jgi:hypothetical protein
MPDTVKKPHVLVSYSPEPAENDRFARRLADGLRRVGFEVSLEAGHGTTEPVSRPEPTERDPDARHTLFIVTKSWLESLSSPAASPAGPNRRVAVRRESIDEGWLASRFPGLASVEWLPDDPEPDARFWELYCRLTRTPEGDPRGWSASGRDLLAGWELASRRESTDAPAEPTDPFPCATRPVLARSARDGTLLLTDSGICFRIERGEATALRPLPDLDGCSAVAVDAAGNLFVGLYDGMIATPRDDEWAYRAADAPVLSLAATPRGLAVGDASGSISVRDPSGRPMATVAAGEPIVDLAASDDGLIALGARGSLWRLRWSDGDSLALATVPPNEALGRPVALFDTGDPARVGVFSAERVAILGRGGRGPTVGVRRFPDGINAVSPFGRDPGETENPPLGLLTDAGRLWCVESDLKRVAPVALPDEAGGFVGLAPGPGGGLLAWTSPGCLLAVDRERKARTLVAVDVALAYVDPDRPDRVAVVQWRPDSGLTFRRLQPEYAR